MTKTTLIFQQGLFSILLCISKYPQCKNPPSQMIFGNTHKNSSIREVAGTTAMKFLGEI